MRLFFRPLLAKMFLVFEPARHVSTWESNSVLLEDSVVKVCSFVYPNMFDLTHSLHMFNRKLLCYF